MVIFHSQNEFNSETVQKFVCKIMSTPNMSEIAKAAGVGKATVSLALRNDPRLRAETRKRIQDVAASMGYQSNAIVSHLMAQLRVSRNPRYQSTIAILNANTSCSMLETNPTFRSMIKGLKTRCLELGYGIDEFWLHDSHTTPKRLRQILQARNIRGVIIAAVFDHHELPAEFDSLWDELACVVLGIRPDRPAFHFACNDQFSTAMHTAMELRALGYQNPGLVIAPVIEDNVDRRFTAGFRTGWIPDASNIPLFNYAPKEETAFREWMKKHTPDVVVCTHPEIRDWLARMKLSCPKDIGVVHLDLSPDLEGWSGMNQKNDLVGALAVDIVIGQLHRNEIGIPKAPICMMTESEWISGGTVRKGPPKSRASKSPARRTANPPQSKK